MSGSSTLLFYGDDRGFHFLSTERDTVQGYRLFTDDPAKAQRYTGLSDIKNLTEFQHDQDLYQCSPISERHLGQLGFTPPRCSEVGAEL